MIWKKLEFLGRRLNATGLQEPGEPLPRVFVLGVVVVRQHRGAHVPLKVLQRQVAPLAARGEPPLLVQVRRRPSVSSANSCTSKETHVRLLDEMLDLVGWPSIPDEPVAILVFGHEVAPGTQTDDTHAAIINAGKTC